jgi:hypothetical protein
VKLPDQKHSSPLPIAEFLVDSDNPVIIPIVDALNKSHAIPLKSLFKLTTTSAPSQADERYDDSVSMSPPITQTITIHEETESVTEAKIDDVQFKAPADFLEVAAP